MSNTMKNQITCSACGGLKEVWMPVHSDSPSTKEQPRVKAERLSLCPRCQGRGWLLDEKSKEDK